MNVDVELLKNGFVRFLLIDRVVLLVDDRMGTRRVLKTLERSDVNNNGV